MLGYMAVDLKLISDMETYQIIEIMVTRGISFISKGYAEANNKSFILFNPNKPTSYITYFNSYGHSMIQLLPNKTLDWVNPEKLNLDNYSDDGPIGFP